MLVEEIVTCSSEGQSSKDAFCIVITEDGMFICSNELHPHAKLASIEVIGERILISQSSEHRLKASLPIEVTEGGIFIFNNFEH